MFGFAWSEWAVIAVVALVIMDPKDIPALIKGIRQCITKFHDIKKEILSVVNELDEASGLRDIKQEAATINQQIRQVVDLEGNTQPAYDLSDMMPELKTKQHVTPVEVLDGSDHKKTTLH